MRRAVNFLTRVPRLQSLQRAGIRFFSTGEESKTVQFSMPFTGHKLEPPPSEATIAKAEYLEMYKTMRYYRRLETLAQQMYEERKIRGFLHLYDGQEAIVVGMEAAITKEDSVITAYRDHCHQLGRGDTGHRVLAELMGKVTGCSHGKGGSMHMYYPKNNFYGGNGIVGAQVPVGAGLALKHKLSKDGRIALAFYGDGAANQGQIFEALNMAALWKLPFIAVCENNLYGMGTSVERASASTEFYTRGDYVPGLRLDGMDVLAVRQGFKFAADWCRAGKGPLVIEALTYRYRGHSVTDPDNSYRPEAEKERMKLRDCITIASNRMLEWGWITEAEILAITRETKKRADEDQKNAEADPFPPATDVSTDVYSGASPPFIRMPNLYQSFSV